MRGTKSLLGLIIILIILLILLILWWIFQQDDTPTANQSKKVFVTENTFTGNLGGPTGADAICSGAAAEAGLSGNFKAWISGRIQSGQDAAGRFSHSNLPYTLVNGTTVAGNWTALTSGTLDHAINVTELGNTVDEGTRVWTNTRIDGFAWDILRDCALGGGPTTWTCDPTTECPFESGKYGIASATDGSWTGQESSNTACSNAYRLYCFQQ